MLNKALLVSFIALCHLILIDYEALSIEGSGFVTSTEIRFDESLGSRKPTPQIPKDWRFVGVSNGEKMNSNNLWFQDKNGNIYLVQGYTSYSQFIVNERVQKLEAK